MDRVEHSGENLAFYLWFKGEVTLRCQLTIDYKKRFFEMPPDLQELSPKPDFDAIDSAQNRVPKLAVRGRNDASPAVTTTTPATLAIANPINEKESKETIQSNDENTLSPPTPIGSIAPWEKEREKKYEPRQATTQSDSFITTSTSERQFSDAAKQPFRYEVFIVQNFLLIAG